MSFITNEVMQTPGSITSLMDQLAALQANLVTEPSLASLEALHPYRWRPDTPDAPAIYNLLLPSTTQQMDTARIRDVFVVATRIGTTYVDIDSKMLSVEAYADAYRALVDVNFWDGQRMPPPLRGAATWAMRRSMQSFYEDFGGVTLTGFEFIQEFSLDHPNRRTN